MFSLLGERKRSLTTFRKAVSMPRSGRYADWCCKDFVRRGRKKIWTGQVIFGILVMKQRLVTGR